MIKVVETVLFNDPEPSFRTLAARHEWVKTFLVTVHRAGGVPVSYTIFGTDMLIRGGKLVSQDPGHGGKP